MQNSWDFISDYFKSVEHLWANWSLSHSVLADFFMFYLQWMERRDVFASSGTEWSLSRTAAGDVVSHHCSQFQMGVGLCIFHLLLWIVSVPSLLCSVPWTATMGSLASDFQLGSTNGEGTWAGSHKERREWGQGIHFLTPSLKGHFGLAVFLDQRLLQLLLGSRLLFFKG